MGSSCIFFYFIKESLFEHFFNSWQALIGLAMFFSCVESILDKYALLNNKVDDTIATFIRIVIYTILASVASVLINGNIPVYLNGILILLGVLNSYKSVTYTKIIKNTDISLIAMLTYIAPIFLIFIDIYLGKIFTILQISLIILIAVCGIWISFNGNNISIKIYFQSCF